MPIKKLTSWFGRNPKVESKAYQVCSEGHCSPLDAYYDAFSGGQFEIPVSRCRSSLLGFKPDQSPFFNTLKAYERGRTSFQQSPLATYYRQFQPKTMADVLGFKSETLDRFHAMATVMPWSHVHPHQRFERFCVNSSDPGGLFLSKEGAQHGLQPGKDYGCQFFGPVSDAHGELEFQRLISVYERISEDGFQPQQFGYIHGEFLIDGNNWVWIAIGGKHRFAVLSALGFERIPIANRARWSAMFVRRSEVDFWPNVRNGLFSRDEALDVFDRFMVGVDGYGSLYSN